MRFKQILQVFLLLLSITACVPYGNLGKLSGNQADMDHADGQAFYRYKLINSTNNFYIDLHIMAIQGSFSWGVRNPDDEIVWQGLAGIGNELDEKHELPMEVGVWTWIVNMEDASGNYSYAWQTE